MKNPVILIIFLLPQFLIAQTDLCQNIYVWPFSNANGRSEAEAAQLTNEVEEALTQAGNCVVLQRRNYATLSSQTENESEIQSLESISESVSRQLETIRAETVLFGAVERDNNGSINLQVSFQSLAGKQILLQKSILLVGADAWDMTSRQEAIGRFITECVNPAAFNEERDWNAAEGVDTKEAYMAYLDKYPSGFYRSDAKRIVEDEMLWSEILGESKDNKQIELLESYRIRQFERHEEDADSMLEELLYQKGKYQRYLDLFPDGKYASQADKKIQEKENTKNKIIDAGIKILTKDDKKPTEEKKPEAKPATTPSNSAGGTDKKSYKLFNTAVAGNENRYLRLDINGKFSGSKNSTYSGCRWELVKKSGNTYNIKNAGDSSFKGRYLHLHNEGKIVASTSLYAGCNWELVKIRGDRYHIRNLGNHNYKGYYLRITATGDVTFSKTVKTGCVWYINDL